MGDHNWKVGDTAITCNFDEPLLNGNVVTINAPTSHDPYRCWVKGEHPIGYKRGRPLLISYYNIRRPNDPPKTKWKKRAMDKIVSWSGLKDIWVPGKRVREQEQEQEPEREHVE